MSHVLLTVGQTLEISNSEVTWIIDFGGYMIDTLKLLIPLSASQHQKLLQIAASIDRWSWALHNQSTGELLFRKVSGLCKTDPHSYHREVRWDVDTSYELGKTYLAVELSLPKFWYGHNISLLYDWQTALRELRKRLNSELGLKKRASLPAVETWKLARCDICYCWRFPDQTIAQMFLDSLKVLHFPRKKPVIYPTAILFTGATYSVKIYLKLPEFKAHDRSELLKQNASLEWVEYLESIADGVLRIEATLRHRYLKRNGLGTVRDLAGFKEWFEWEKPPTSEEDAFAQMMALSMVALQARGVDLESSSWWEGETRLVDGMVLTAPAGLLQYGDRQYTLPGNSATFRKMELPAWTLQQMLKKFVGEVAEMRTVDKVQQVLLQHYKPVKAARLVSFWLYVRQFGSQRTKDDFGRDSYYYNRKQLVKAGVSLLEPPDLSKVTPLNRGFLESFALIIPSPHVGNKVDDFRDSQNVINFVPKAN